MYRCKICNRTYSVKNKYCECGSNDFEVIESKTKQEPKKSLMQLIKEASSWIIFAVCVICAIIVLFL